MSLKFKYLVKLSAQLEIHCFIDCSMIDCCRNFEFKNIVLMMMMVVVCAVCVFVCLCCVCVCCVCCVCACVCVCVRSKE